MNLEINDNKLKKTLHILLLIFPTMMLFCFTIYMGRNAFSWLYTPLTMLLIFLIAYFAPKLKIPYAPLLIFITALILRLICLKYWTINPLSDAKQGLEFSMQLANAKISDWNIVFSQSDYYYNVWPMHSPHKIYQTLALFMFGKNIYSIQLLNVMFSALSCVFTYLIAKALFSEKAGLTAGFLMVFNPTALLFSALLVNQHPSTTFCLAALFVYLKKPCKSHWLNIIISALLLTISQLLRPEMYIVLIAIFCYEIYLAAMENLDYRKILGFLAYCVVFFLLLLAVDKALMSAGWINNSILNSNLKYKIAVGQNQATEGRFLDSDYPLAGDEEALDRLLIERLSPPKETLILMYKKLLFQFSSYNYWWLQADKGGNLRQYILNNAFDPVLQSYMMIIMLFALLNTIFKRNKKENALLHIIFIGFLISFALMEVQQRYAYLFVYIFTIWGSNFMSASIERLKSE